MNLKSTVSILVGFFYLICFLIYSGTCYILIIIALKFLKPWGMNLTRKITNILAQLAAVPSLLVNNYWIAMDIILYIEADVYKNNLGKEHALAVSNHISFIDSMVYFTIFSHYNIFPKSYIKNAVKYVPILGWIFAAMEYVFLTRNYNKDKETLKEAAQKLAQFQDPLIVCIFPEGSRFTPEKHKQSLQFAKEKGLKELKHHLNPRTKGFVISVPYFRKTFKALYDVEFAYVGPEPSILNWFKGKHMTVHVCLKRIPMEALPEGEKELETFLLNMFYKKDDTMSMFKETGSFFEISDRGKYIKQKISLSHRLIIWSILSLVVALFVLKFILIAFY